MTRKEREGEEKERRGKKGKEGKDVYHSLLSHQSFWENCKLLLVTCTYHFEVQGDDYVLGGHVGIEDLPLYVFIQYKCCPKVTAILGEGDCARGALKVLGRERGRDSKGRGDMRQVTGVTLTR